MNLDASELRYLHLLARQFPTIQAASTEIINLTAILNLPKGTENFISDVHGEFEAFLHVLKNGSGSLRRKVEEFFGPRLLGPDKRNLITLIYYPEQKLPLILNRLAEEDVEDWYRMTLLRLVRVCRVVSSKYTRSKVRKALPTEFAYIIEELLHEQESIENKTEYYQAIIDTIISTGQARQFIVAMAELIQRLNIDHLHLLGDVYDRGPGAHIIMDALMDYHSVDFQWGNHDILWMGAAAGSEACMANVFRICLRYANMETLESGYAISVMPLATFAMQAYGDDPCFQFRPKVSPEEYTEHEVMLMARMQKAITVIQFKLEGQIIRRRPGYGMDDRLLLDKIDREQGTVTVDGQPYALNDTNFPTIDPARPYELTDEERTVVERLMLSFTENETLHRHIRFLYAAGSMYLCHNGNLLYHGCIPMNEDGSFTLHDVDGEQLGPRAYMDLVDRRVRQAYFGRPGSEEKQRGLDAMWYLWCGPQSPLFGKHKMATFERYFVDDKSVHAEPRNPYYDYRDQEETACRILEEFGLDPETSHIINGHVPVKVVRGERPVKAGGKLLVIDGGFSKAYQKETGIAGYTLVYNSYGLLLAAHEPFVSTRRAIESETDIYSKTEILETSRGRIRVKDTDRGRELQGQIDDLTRLLDAYRAGLIKERK